MAVAFNAATLVQGQGSSLTLSHNPAGTNRLLWVAVAWLDPAAGEQLPIINPRFGAVALTQVGGDRLASEVTGQVYRLIAPATGSANVTATWPQTVNYAAVAVSYVGVHQSAPLGTPAVANATNTTPAVLVAGTVDGNMVADMLVVSCGVSSVTASSHGAQLERVNVQQGASGSRLRFAGSDDFAGGDVDMAWTLSVSRPWSQLAAEIMAAPAAGTVAGRTGGLGGLKRLGRMTRQG